jgi:hypothetical protein
MTAEAVARYVQLGTQNSTPANYASGNVQGWYNTTRKGSDLVLPIESGTPKVTAFQLLAPGWWIIEANAKFSVTATLNICLNGIGTSTVMAMSGLINSPNVTVAREFSVNSQIMTRWDLSGSGTMTQAADDQNHISFTYLGAV